jgi:hypothetical protein
MNDTDRKNVRLLYAVLGFRQGVCRSCQTEIWWGQTSRGRAIPLTDEAMAHFADCPAANAQRQETH